MREWTPEMRDKTFCIATMVLWLALTGLALFVIIGLLTGCAGRSVQTQAGRVPEQDTSRWFDLRRVLVGSPGSDIFNIEVGASILGSIIVGAMFIQVVRANSKNRRLATAFSKGIEAVSQNKKVTKAIRKELPKQGLSEVAVAKFRKKVGTSSEEKKE